MANIRQTRRWPGYLFGGRLRTSTLVLVLAFVAIWWLYETYEPGAEPPPQIPATDVVPPGFIPDPDYTWVPRTNVMTTTATTAPTPTTPPTEPTASEEPSATDIPTSGDRAPTSESPVPSGPQAPTTTPAVPASPAPAPSTAAAPAAAPSR